MLMALEIDMRTPGLWGVKELSRCHIWAEYLGGGGRGGERQAGGGGAFLSASVSGGWEASPPSPSLVASTWLLPMFVQHPSPLSQGQSARKQRRRRAKTKRQEGPLSEEQGGELGVRWEGMGREQAVGRTERSRKEKKRYGILSWSREGDGQGSREGS